MIGQRSYDHTPLRNFANEIGFILTLCYKTNVFKVGRVVHVTMFHLRKLSFNEEFEFTFRSKLVIRGPFIQSYFCLRHLKQIDSIRSENVFVLCITIFGNIYLVTHNAHVSPYIAMTNNKYTMSEYILMSTSKTNHLLRVNEAKKLFQTTSICGNRSLNQFDDSCC